MRPCRARCGGRKRSSLLCQDGPSDARPPPLRNFASQSVECAFVKLRSGQVAAPGRVFEASEGASEVLHVCSLERRRRPSINRLGFRARTAFVSQRHDSHSGICSRNEILAFLARVILWARREIRRRRFDTCLSCEVPLRSMRCCARQADVRRWRKGAVREGGRKRERSKAKSSRFGRRGAS